jgi:hypothetical protein
MLDMPGDLVMEIYAFFVLSDIIFLDTAICNKSQRKHIFFIYQSNFFNILEYSNRSSHLNLCKDPQLQWVLNRRLKFQVINFFFDEMNGLQQVDRAINCERIISIIVSAPKLRELSLHNCPMNLVGFEMSLVHKVVFQRLVILSCVGSVVTVSLIAQLCIQCRQLEDLQLHVQNKQSRISEKVILPLLANNVCLEKIDLFLHSNLSDNLLETVVAYCPRVKHLELRSSTTCGFSACGIRKFLTKNSLHNAFVLIRHCSSRAVANFKCLLNDAGEIYLDGCVNIVFLESMFDRLSEIIPSCEFVRFEDCYFEDDDEGEVFNRVFLALRGVGIFVEWDEFSDDKILTSDVFR